jgi:hypothetical protein
LTSVPAILSASSATADINLVASAGVLAMLHPLLLPLLMATIAPKGWSAVRAARARFASAKRYMDLTRQLEVQQPAAVRTRCGMPRGTYSTSPSWSSYSDDEAPGSEMTFPPP